MKQIVLLIVLGLLPILLGIDGYADPAGMKTNTLVHQGLTRTYHVYLPPGYSRGKAAPAPLVIALHGGGGTGEKMNRGTGRQITREADRRSWVAVFPEGVNNGWNDGRKINTFKDRRRSKVDDVGFIAKLIDRLHTDFNIDRKRVYATGISNGGFMSLRLAVELSDRIAAVGAVTASLGKVLEHKIPKQPVGVLFMNGTRDPLVPYEGGQVKVLGRSRGEILSTEASVQWWVKHLDCGSSPKRSQLPDTVRIDGTHTEVERYTDCRGRVQVILYRVIGGGHTWPGGTQYLPKKLIGPVSRDFQATNKIFDFFAQHHR
jgi:polyhydroxybutyrate depolymerase